MSYFTTRVETDSLGRLLTVWRVAGGLTQAEAAEFASCYLPYTISREMVRRLEAGPKNDPDPIVVAALTLAYRHSLEELPESVLGGVILVYEMLAANLQGLLNNRST